MEISDIREKNLLIQEMENAKTTSTGEYIPPYLHDIYTEIEIKPLIALAMRRVGSTPSSDDSGEKYVDYDTEHYISDDSYSETETLGGAGNQITTEEFASNLRQAGIHKANQELYRKLIRTFKKIPIEQKADFIKRTQSMVNKTQNMEQYKKFGTEMGMDAQEFQENLTDFIERPLTSQNEILRGMQQALERDQSSFVTENIPVSSTETSTTKLSSIRPINRIPDIDLAEAGPSGVTRAIISTETDPNIARFTTALESAGMKTEANYQTMLNKYLKLPEVQQTRMLAQLRSIAQKKAEAQAEKDQLLRINETTENDPLIPQSAQAEQEVSPLDRLDQIAQGIQPNTGVSSRSNIERYSAYLQRIGQDPESNLYQRSIRDFRGMTEEEQNQLITNNVAPTEERLPLYQRILNQQQEAGDQWGDVSSNNSLSPRASLSSGSTGSNRSSLSSSDFSEDRNLLSQSNELDYFSSQARAPNNLRDPEDPNYTSLNRGELNIGEEGEAPYFEERGILDMNQLRLEEEADIAQTQNSLRSQLQTLTSNRRIIEELSSNLLYRREAEMYRNDLAPELDSSGVNRAFSPSGIRDAMNEYFNEYETSQGQVLPETIAGSEILGEQTLEDTVLVNSAAFIEQSAQLEEELQNFLEFDAI